MKFSLKLLVLPLTLAMAATQAVPVEVKKEVKAEESRTAKTVKFVKNNAKTILGVVGAGIDVYAGYKAFPKLFGKAVVKAQPKAASWLNKYTVVAGTALLGTATWFGPKLLRKYPATNALLNKISNLFTAKKWL